MRFIPTRNVSEAHCRWPHGKPRKSLGAFLILTRSASEACLRFRCAQVKGGNSLGGVPHTNPKRQRGVHWLCARNGPELLVTVRRDERHACREIWHGGDL